MDDAVIEEWDYDYFITIREQTVDWVERLGQGMVACKVFLRVSGGKFLSPL